MGLTARIIKAISREMLAPPLETGPSFRPELVSSSEVYRCLYTSYLHQDRLAWSRTQALVAIEAGLVAAAFSQKGLFAALILVTGTLLLYLIWRLIRRDFDNRDMHRDVLDRVHKPLGISMGKQPPCPAWAYGRRIIGIVFVALAIVNILLAMYFWGEPWTCNRSHVVITSPAPPVPSSPPASWPPKP
jgi:hypothetical protein